jgi:hypothetical protein
MAAAGCAGPAAEIEEREQLAKCRKPSAPQGSPSPLAGEDVGEADG